MELSPKNLNLLNDENKKKFRYLSIKHAFPTIKSFLLANHENDEEEITKEVVEYVEKWIKDSESVDKKIFNSIRSLLYRSLNNESHAAISIAYATTTNIINVPENINNSLTWAFRGKFDTAGQVKENLKEQKWQEKLLDYLLKQQSMQSQLGNPDDPLELARDLIHKVKNGELKKDELGYRTQIHNYLKDVDPEDRKMVIDYLKSHQVYENLKKTIKEEIIRILKV